jgi:hypothetical protein
MSDTTYRLREAGNLYVGDVVALPGDLLATVEGFEYPEDRPGVFTLVTDLATIPAVRTTDTFRVQVTAVLA